MSAVHDPRTPPPGSEVRVKQVEHDEIARHIEEFLARGGVIQKFDFGATSGIDLNPHVNETRASRKRIEAAKKAAEETR